MRRFGITIVMGAILCACSTPGRPKTGENARPRLACGESLGGHPPAAHPIPETTPESLTLYSIGPNPRIEASSTQPVLAAGKRWFAENEVIVFRGQRYAKFGWALGARPSRTDPRGTRVALAGEYDGVPVYGEAGADTPPRLLFVQLNASCQFQPYARAPEVQ